MDEAAVPILLGCLDRELWLVTAEADGRRGGLIATFVSPASIVDDLPRMCVGLARTHRTWELVEASGAFALHLLGANNLEWVWRFGLASGRDGDKFVGLTVRRGSTGSPLLDGAIGWLDCRVEAKLDAGDRTLYVAAVVGAGASGSDSPLTAKQMMQLAPPDKLAELKRQRHADSLADAEAIRVWRRRN